MSFSEIPTANNAETNADIDDVRVPQRYNLEEWINDEIQAYRNGIRTTTQVITIHSMESMHGFNPICKKAN